MKKKRKIKAKLNDNIFWFVQKIVGFKKGVSFKNWFRHPPHPCRVNSMFGPSTDDLSPVHLVLHITSTNMQSIPVNSYNVCCCYIF